VYVLLAPILIRNGYPAILALLIAAGTVIFPFELGYLFLKSMRTNGTFSLKSVTGLREPLPKWQYFVFPFAMVVWAFLSSGALSLVDPVIAKTLFGWLPDWFFLFDPNQYKPFAREALLTTFYVVLVINGLLGPITEELYFRGHLLPRISRLGGWAPLVNISLFSLYHFWTPWEFFSRIIWLLPWGYVVWRKKNFYLMMIAHCAVNLLGALLTWGRILGQN
jgi:membrane protease YdiL (CAAX protease family)